MTAVRERCAAGAARGRAGSLSSMSPGVGFWLALVTRVAAAQTAPTPTPQAGPPPASPATAPSVQTAPSSQADEVWAVHAQSTFIEQYHPAFRSAFRGPNSLDPGSRGNETYDATLYAGIRPWAGAEFWFDGEINQGFGLSNTEGLVGFPNGEGAKVGASDPYARIPRVFLRQTIDLGGEAQRNEADINVLGQNITADRIVMTIGKFSVPDVFDVNDYAHDPRHDFMNWTLIDMGTFDYAADAWGYSYGFAAEWYQSWWALRAGAFALSVVPNDKALDTSGSQFQMIGEAEARYTAWGQAGKLKLLGFITRGRMGDFNDALASARETDTLPSVAAVREYRSRAGIGLNWQQAVTADIGLFARAGIAEGGREVYEFTDVDKSISGGFSLAGKAWGRPDDTWSLGAVLNDGSRRRKNYLAAGGLGILTGDGALPNSGPEAALETFYSYAVNSHIALSADYQFFNNPAYNRDRGPVSVLGFRAHVQY